MFPLSLRLRHVVVASAVLGIALELAALAGWTSAPHDAIAATARGEAPFLASAFAGAFVLYRASHLGARAWRTTLATAVSLETLQLLVRLTAGQSAKMTLQSVGFGAGTAATIALVLRALGRSHDASDKAVHRIESEPSRAALLAAVVLMAFALLSSSLIDLTRALHPATLDAFVYRADQGFGFPVSFAAGVLFEHVPSLRVTSEIVYVELPLFCALVQADELSRRHAPFGRALTLIVALGVVGSALYHLFPVAGPVFAFAGRYPYLPPSPERVELAPMLVTADVARNCMPSLHTAWALALVWHTREARRPLRWLTWLCLGWTIAATLGLGYHYFIDLVVAVPFLTAVRAISAWHLTNARKSRAAACAVGVALVSAWLVALRWCADWFASRIALTWMLAAASTVLAFAMDVRLFSTTTATAAHLAVQARATAERLG